MGGRGAENRPRDAAGDPERGSDHAHHVRRVRERAQNQEAHLVAVAQVGGVLDRERGPVQGEQLEAAEGAAAAAGHVRGPGTDVSEPGDRVLRREPADQGGPGGGEGAGQDRGQGEDHVADEQRKHQRQV